jgi:hypothetical protein
MESSWNLPVATEATVFEIAAWWFGSMEYWYIMNDFPFSWKESQLTDSIIFQSVETTNQIGKWWENDGNLDGIIVEKHGSYRKMMGKSWENDGNLHGICQVGFHGCHGMICRLGFVLSQRDSAFLTPIMAWELPSWGLNPREELEGPGNYEVHDFFCSKKPWSSMVSVKLSWRWRRRADFLTFILLPHTVQYIYPLVNIHI